MRAVSTATKESEMSIKLNAAGWTRLSEHVWERAGLGGLYTLLLGEHVVTIVNPLGRRAVRRLESI
jgi:hypothetical protein